MDKIDVLSSVVLEKSFLERALISMKAVFRKTSGELDSSIIIRSKDESLQLIADDGGVYVRTMAPAMKIENLDQWCVDGVLLSKFVRGMDKGKVTIESDKTNIYAKQGSTLMKVPLIERNKQIPTYDPNTMVKLNIDGNKLLKGIKQVTHAASGTLAHNVALMGIHINYTNKGFEVVATDSKRLGLYSTIKEDEGEVEKLYSFTIFKSVADEITKVFSGNIGVYVQERELNNNKYVECLGIVGDGVEFYTKTINTEYVEYKAIIDRETTLAVPFNKDSFSQKIKQLNVSSDHTRLTVSPDKVKLNSVEGKHGSEITIELEGEYDVQEDFVIGLNNRYVLESLDAVSSTNFLFKFEVPDKPLFIIEHHEEEFRNRYKSVMMPHSLPEHIEEAKQKANAEKEAAEAQENENE